MMRLWVIVVSAVWILIAAAAFADVSGVVRDTSPMMNRHDPNVDPEVEVGRTWLTSLPKLIRRYP